MYKQEADCSVCTKEFIVVDKDGNDIAYCPMCGSPLEQTHVNDDEEE